MASVSKINLSGIALIFGLVFILSALGCGERVEATKFKIKAPTIHMDADETAQSFKDFEAQPAKLTSAHYLKFKGNDANGLEVKTTCSVTPADTKESARTVVGEWSRPFSEKVYILEILPKEIALTPFAKDESVVCSFDFKAQKNVSTHSFRLMSVAVDFGRYVENIEWDSPAAASARHFKSVSQDERSTNSSGKRRFNLDLFCTTGSQTLRIPEGSKISEDIVRNMVELMEAQGEVTWATTVQECTLARIENNVVVARSKGFVLSYAPTVKVTFIPRADNSYDVRNLENVPNGGKGKYEFRGGIGEVIVKNDSDVPTRVVIPKVINGGASIQGLVETRSNTNEVKYFCEYDAALRLSKLSGDVIDDGTNFIVPLGPYDARRFNAALSHEVGYLMSADILFKLNGRLAPFIAVYEGVEPVQDEVPVTYASLSESNNRVRLSPSGRAPTKHYVGPNSMTKSGKTKSCKVKHL